jgi:hypothetical protein
MNYTLRTSRSEDAQTIIGWFSTHQEAIIWGGSEVPEPLTANWLAQQFLDPKRHCYGGEGETRLVVPATLTQQFHNVVVSPPRGNRQRCDPVG